MTTSTLRPGMAFRDDPLDRADLVRKDPAALAALRARDDAVLATLWRGQAFALDGPKPGGGVVEARAYPSDPDEVFLGLDRGAPVFARALDPSRSPGREFPLDGLGAWSELRALAARLHPADASLLGLARSVLDWHARHQYCARCGVATAPTEGGWKRVCPACAAEHFPRVDPVVIMLIHSGDKVLLGRQAAWPPGMHSCLAGFVEPGETLEAAVAREALEEAGLAVTEVAYVASQPWPFPSSLMVGMRARALSEDARADETELEAVRWFTRDEVQALIEARHPDAAAPPAMAIAHHLLAEWLNDAPAT